MRDLLGDLGSWVGRRAVVARVVDLEGSGPRGPGAAMAVDADSTVLGSVSGGCVEGAVVTDALDLLATGAAPRVVSFGYSDDDAFAVGLTCGGTIRLFLAPLSTLPVAELRAAVDAERPAALATVVAGPNAGATVLVTGPERHHGTLGNAALDRVVTRDAWAALQAGQSETRHYGADGQAMADDVTVFVESFAPPPRLVVFGAVDFTRALVRIGALLGFRTTVCDAREVFATRARFPEADEVVVDWPHRFLEARGHELGPRDAVCVLTHDHRFDVPAVVAALATDVGYLGVMGSRRTHDERLARLAEAGVDATQIARMRSPIGLDLGGRTPEETAVSICAEIIACRTGRADGPVSPLRDTAGDLH